MTERKPPGMSFETWIDHQITSAEARGAFADLPGAGRPLPRRHREQTSYEWALEWARRENGDAAGMLPPGLALRKEREDLPAVVARLPSEAAVRALAEDFNARVREFWRRPQEGPAVTVGPADVDALLAEWRRTRPPAPSPAGPASAPSFDRSRPRRRWFPRRRPH